MSEGRRSLLALLQRMSAREVAARCQVAPSTVSRWASGEMTPCPRARSLLSEHCGIEWTVDEWTPRAKLRARS